MRKTLLFILWLCPMLLSASPNWEIRHYDNLSGLSHNAINCIHQDKKGFMWFGTRNGLNRFDGHTFKTYLRTGQPDGLPNSFINSIAEDAEGQLWIATDNGVSIYNPITDSFRPLTYSLDSISLTDRVNQIYVDAEGCVWMMTGNSIFNYYDETIHDITDKLTYYFGNFPNKMHVDQHAAYFYVPYQGIIRSDRTAEHISTVMLSESYNTTALCEYGPNKLLMGTRDDGLFIIDDLTGAITPIPIDEQSAIEKNALFIHSIIPINNGEFWLGTMDGLLTFHDNKLSRGWEPQMVKREWKSDNIPVLYKDNKGGIWLGTFYNGIYYYHERQSIFNNYSSRPDQNSVCGRYVRDFIEDNQGHLWIATEDNGICLFDASTGLFSVPMTSNGEKLPDINVQCLTFDPNDELWIGSWMKGLYHFDIHTGQLQHYLDNNIILSFLIDHEGVIWMGDTEKLYTFDPKTGQRTPFDLNLYTEVSSIMEDRDKNLWVSTFGNGVFCINRQREKVQNYHYDANDPHSLCFGRVTCSMMDSSGDLWFGTDDGGLCRFDGEKQIFYRVTTNDGLPTNAIYSMAEDDNQYLWLGTGDGLVQLDISTMKVQAMYNIVDGLPSKQFVHHASFRLRSGQMAFGCSEGFVLFNPSRTIDEEREQQIAITGLFINNEEIKPSSDKGSILQQALPYANHIQLNYDESTFMLTFSTLDYQHEGQGIIGYQLQGFDTQWNYTSNTHSIAYHNIPPGHYTFYIRSQNNLADQSPPQARITIDIRPPFWKSGLAKMLYTLLALAIAFVLSYIISVNIRHRRDTIQKEQEKQLYKAKLDFFTNIAHEIRTPLTLIKAPLEMVRKHKDLPDDVNDDLDLINSSADRLLNLMNELLDFRKVEEEAFRVTMDDIDLKKLLTDIWNDFGLTGFSKRLEMELILPDEPIEVQLDKEATTKILSNIIGNAMKYADSYIRLSLTVVPQAPSPLLRIEEHNDGPQIPPEMQKKIFEPFIQINGDKYPQQGTGLGLALASSLTELQGGSLIFDSTSADNTFVLTLPWKKASDNKKQREVDLFQPMQTENKPTATKDIQTAKKSVNQQATKSQISENAPQYTLLIVEDDADMRSYIAKVFADDYHVLYATNGVEALNILRDEIIHLVISDVMMPLKDGMELLQDIKSGNDTCHIPVILLTAKTIQSSHLEGLNYGADAYVEKPFIPDMLKAQVANLIASRRILQEKFAQGALLPEGIDIQDKVDERLLQLFVDHITRSIDNPDLNIDILAEQMRMSRSTFYRRIKAITGQTPNELIRAIRLNYAAELFRDGRYRISEICTMVGISSTSYFSKAFQRQFGMSPREFIQQEKKEANPSDSTN